jgi:hypothetical protein
MPESLRKTHSDCPSFLTRESNAKDPFLKAAFNCSSVPGPTSDSPRFKYHRLILNPSTILPSIHALSIMASLLDDCKDSHMDQTHIRLSMHDKKWRISPKQPTKYTFKTTSVDHHCADPVKLTYRQKDYLFLSN